MDGIVGEIVPWPQVVVAVTLIVASVILPQGLSYLKDRPAVPKVEVTRSEPAKRSHSALCASAPIWSGRSWGRSRTLCTAVSASYSSGRPGRSALERLGHGSP